MDSIHIQGGIPLSGVVKIAGAKNATLPLMTAALLTDEPLILSNVPSLMDITSLSNLLKDLGQHISEDYEPFQASPFLKNRTLTLHTPTITNQKASYDLVRKMRASILVLGPLLARTGEAFVSLPGGCAIGTRPVNIHIKALEHLGAHITLENGYIHATAPKGLKGGEFTFPMVTVTGTENLIMAACLAQGTTCLRNAAREPEISDLIRCLIKMGADIEGVGTDTLIIKGVSRLKGAHHSVIPDRIEFGTYAIAAAITRGELTLIGADTALLPSFLPKLEEIGVRITEVPEGLKVSGKDFSFKGVEIITDPFPGFPTDLQAQIMTLLCIAEGNSRITETIFENRFMHVPELMRMGANISIQGNTVTTQGVSHLIGAEVMATDLRASFSLVLGGLIARGTTIVNRVYHLDRGYEYVEDKLTACGAQIKRIKPASK